MTLNRKIGDLVGDFTKKLVTRMDDTPYLLWDNAVILFLYF